MGDEQSGRESALVIPAPIQTRAPGFTIPGAPDTIVDSTRPTKRVGPATSATDAKLGAARQADRYADPIEIGRGGMGRVYRVKDQDLNRDIAMKVLSRATSDDSVERFIAEAQISGQLEHPSLLPIHDFGVNADGEAYFTMRYVPHHETLHEIIHRLKFSDAATHSHYTIERRVQIIQRVCDALTYAHQRGVIHRDIKPSNIIIGDTGEIYLADWGLAKLVDTAQAKAPIDSTMEIEPTEQGEIAGTPLYMSPEQFLAEKALTPKTDVYSLCAVAYEFLSLRHYLGEAETADYQVLMDATLFAKRKDAEDHFDPQNGRVPRQLSRILRMGLQTDRDLGIESSEELHSLLQEWVEGKAPVVCPGTFIQHCLGRVSRGIDRRPVLAPIVILMIFMVFTGGLLIAALSLAGVL